MKDYLSVYQKGETLMSRNKTPNNQKMAGNANKPESQENEKRENQVPNSKNPKVPGNESP